MRIPLIFLIILCTVSFVSAQTDSTGIALFNQRKYSESQKFFEKAVKNNDKDAEGWYYLAYSNLALGELDDAEDEIDEAIDLNENVSKYHLLRGQILGQEAQDANIISQGILAVKVKNAFLRASELDPANIQAHTALFNYYSIAPGIMGGQMDAETSSA